MIRKTAAFFFILIANILLLAHAVVPHHHHGKQVCLVQSHCIGVHDSDEQGAEGTSHHHDGENNPDNCILKELIAVPSNEWNQEIKFTTGYNYLHNYYAFLYGLPVTGEKAFVPVARRFINALKIDSSYTLYASTSLGLRAPPVV